MIGAIIEKSPADLDGRLRPGDELLFVDGIPVVGKPHRYVIDLMHGAARNGQVNLVIRRRVQAAGEENGVLFFLLSSINVKLQRFLLRNRFDNRLIKTKRSLV